MMKWNIGKSGHCGLMKIKTQSPETSSISVKMTQLIRVDTNYVVAKNY